MAISVRRVWSGGVVRWLRAVILFVGFVGVTSGHVRAHLPSPGVTWGAVAFPVALGVSAGLGALGGLIVAAGWSQNHELSIDQPSKILGMALVVIGLLLLVPIVSTRPIVSVGGLVFGGVAGTVLPGHQTSDPEVVPTTATFGALAVHRVIEGAALATAYGTGALVGTVTAGILTLHMFLETAIVAGLYREANHPTRGVVAILLMQTGFVLAASTVLVTAIAVTSVARITVTAAVAGLLLFLGGHECRE